MGYNIYYEGKIKIDKPLDDETYNIIMGLSESRRMTWDADKLERDGIAKKSEIGEVGEFFFGHKDMEFRQLKEFEKKYILNCNCPPGSQPSLNGVWIVTNDRMGLVWNRNEKSYGGHNWLKYIVEKILKPKGYNAEGIINWFTEEYVYDNRWHTIVKGNSVRKYRGFNKKEKEPDIDAWYDEEIQGYEENHQQWLQKLIDNKIEFLHESIPWEIYKTDAKLVISFNLYIDNNIVQAVYDRKSICHAKYLYKNIRTENNKLIHDKSCNDDEIIDDITLQKAKKIIENYMSQTSNYFEKKIF